MEIGIPHFSEKHTNTDSIKVPTNRLGAARPSPLDTMLPTLNHLLPYGNVFARAPTSSIVIHTSLNILSDSVSQNNRTHYFYLGTWHRRETVYPTSLAAMHGQITKFWTRECERKWHIQPGCVLKWWAPSFLWVLTWIIRLTEVFRIIYKQTS